MFPVARLELGNNPEYLCLVRSPGSKRIIKDTVWNACGSHIPSLLQHGVMRAARGPCSAQRLSKLLTRLTLIVSQVKQDDVVRYSALENRSGARRFVAAVEW